MMVTRTFWCSYLFMRSVQSHTMSLSASFWGGMRIDA
jgi:hypothetical protein